MANPIEVSALNRIKLHLLGELVSFPSFSSSNSNLIQNNKTYSKPVVALDMTWNMAFVVVSMVILACTVKEKPNTLIRWWICGYTLQCLVDATLMWLEYSRRNDTLHSKPMHSN
ncbi:hypothetical protein VNO78_22685 [Psophocarpus tetragonolobus]|uniref:Uncharacterized protein n=1 Tax=Psophocarpus tetragonolobus TaxID=3891 RepID=A0AAN9S2D4_PSOTE